MALQDTPGTAEMRAMAALNNAIVNGAKKTAFDGQSIAVKKAMRRLAL